MHRLVKTITVSDGVDERLKSRIMMYSPSSRRAIKAKKSTNVKLHCDLQRSSI